MKILNIKWSAISLLIIVCVFSVWYFFPEAKKQPQCTDRAEYIHVKLGEHVFSVPWKESWLHLKYGDKTIDDSKLCYQFGDPPIEVTQFSFSPRGKDKRNGYIVRKYAPSELQDKTKEGFSLNVSVRIANDNVSNKENDSFNFFVKKELQKTNTKLSTLLKEGEFYIQQLPYNERNYISSTKDFTSPNGNPIAFICRPFAMAAIKGNLSCGMSIKWKDNINFGFGNLSQTYVPPSRLKEFYYDFLQYMESLEVKNQETNNQITGTQP